MDVAYRVILGVHIVSACAAVVLFWAAVAARKGSPRHLQVGRLYVRAMLVMMATAALLCARLIVFEVPGFREVGAVLLPVSFLMAALSWQGGRAARRRTYRTLCDRMPEIAGAVGLTLSGVGSVALGSLPGLEIASRMGVVLIAVGGFQLYELVRFVPRRWLGQHLAGILMSGTFLHASLVTQVGTHLVDGLEGTEIFVLGIPVFVVGLVATVGTILYYTQPSLRRVLALQGEESPIRVNAKLHGSWAPTHSE